MSKKNTPKPNSKSLAPRSLSRHTGIKKQSEISSALSDPSFQKYIQAISKHPLLSIEEERQLTQEYYQTRKPEIAKALVSANLRFVVKIALNYLKTGVQIMDLVQEGNMGLIKAVQEFNPQNDNRLLSYAVWWIRGEITKYLLKHHSIVQIGSSQKQKALFYNLKNALKDTENFEGVPLLTHSKMKDVQSQFSVDEKQLKNFINHFLLQDVRLDQNIENTEESKSLHEVFASKERSPQDIIIDNEQKEILLQTLMRLKDQFSRKEAIILKDRILSRNPRSLQDIADEFNVTREAIRQNETQIIRKIKEEFERQKYSTT